MRHLFYREKRKNRGGSTHIAFLLAAFDVDVRWDPEVRFLTCNVRHFSTKVDPEAVLTSSFPQQPLTRKEDEDDETELEIRLLPSVCSTSIEDCSIG